MDDPLSTEDASDTQQFDTLEGMIKYTTRNKDDEIPHTVRLEGWQLSEIDKIKNYLNTNRVEVMVRAYRMGTDIMRGLILDDINSIVKMDTVFSHISMNTLHQTNDIDSIIGEALNVEIEFNYESGNGLSDPIHARLDRSYFSEVENTFVVDARLGGWVHRVIIGLGLSKSSNLAQYSKKHVDNYIDTLVNGVNETRYELEDVIRRYINLNTNYWIMNGIEIETYSGLEEIYTHMETEHKEEVETFLNIDGMDKIEGEGEPPPGGDN